MKDLQWVNDFWWVSLSRPWSKDAWRIWIMLYWLCDHVRGNLDPGMHEQVWAIRAGLTEL